MALRVWLPLNGTLENKGISNVTVTNNGATVNNNGKIGKCYSFNGSSNYLYTTYNFYNSTYSISSWIYTTSSSVTQTIICDRTAVGSGFSTFLIGGKLRIDAGGNSLQWETNYTYPVNTWFHLTITYDGTNVCYYINGEFKETKAQAINSSYWGSVTSIGASQQNGSGYGNYLNGHLNDIRIYNHCLSAKEVKEISQGLVLHYKLDGFSGGSGENLALDTTNKIVTATASGTDVNKNIALDYGWQSNWSKIRGKTITISCDIELVNAVNTTGVSFYRVGIEPALKYADNTTGYYGIWVTLNSTPQTSSKRYTKTITLPDKDLDSILQNGAYIQHLTNGSATIKNIKVELGDIATPWSPSPLDFGIDTTKITDSSGYGNDGIITGTLSTESDSNRYEISTHYSGSSYTDTGAGTFNWFDFSQCTLSAWIKSNASVSGWSGSIGVQHDQNAGHKGFTITDYANNFRVVTVNGSYTTIDSGKPLTVGEWHHCAAVLNGTNLKMYYDGAMVKESTVSWGSAAIATDMRFATGVDFPGSNEMFTGNYSDVRMYCTALSAEDILDLYHTSANIDDLGNLHGFEFIEDESKQSIYKNGQIATKYELQNNLWSGTQINVSNMAVTYNYQTDVFRNYGFDTCMKFTSTHIADGTSWYGYSYICDNTIVHNLAETYTFSMYAYVSTDCNANFRVHTEHANSWVSNYQGTTANINDMTKGQVIKVWGKAKTNASDGKIYLMFYFNPHLVDTFTTGYILVAGLNVVIGDTIYPPGIMPMNGFNQDKNISSINNDLIIMNDFIEK